MKKWYDSSGLYLGVFIRNVVDVPRETMASRGRSGRAKIVAGLSPVKGRIWQSELKPYRDTK